MLAAVETTALRAAKNGLDLSEQQSLRCPHCGAGPFGTFGELQGIHPPRAAARGSRPI
jgi:hypothetical protein